MTSDFDALVKTALAAMYKGDLFLTGVLADFLQDRGDERAVRLRRSLVIYERRKASLDEKIGWLLNTPDTPELGAPDPESGLDFLKNYRVMILDEWVSYFIRLMSVAPGQRVPRARVSDGYLSVQPQG